MDDLDPSTAGSFDDLAACLRHVHLRADKPTYRALEQQTIHANEFLPGTRLRRVRLARSTLSDMLLGRKFPSKAFLLTFIDECGIDLENDSRWEQAWDRLAVQYQQVPSPPGDVERVRQENEKLRLENNELRQKLAVRGVRTTLKSVQDVLVIGLGYVGLPLAVQAVRVGIQVTGLDTSEKVVAGLMAGRSHVDDVTDAEVAETLNHGFRATTDEAVAGPADVIAICVPTPLSDADGPDLSAVRAATATAGRLLRPGTLVSLESTTYPGTTEEVVRPLLEKASGLVAGTDFSLAFSPERIDPGNPVYGFRNTPKIIGGLTPACTDAAEGFYARICDQVVRAKSAREAEMAKLLENTYRHVNIALVNEMLIFCRELDVDLWDAIRCAATKPFGFQPFYPGPGVGGHCVPIDPNYLSYKVRTLGYPFRFVELTREINGRMPGYVTDRAGELLNRHAKAVNGAKVLLLGVTYKRDIADERESPARPVARKLLGRGAVVSYHDPFVPDWQVDGQAIPRAKDLEEALAAADLVILLQAHQAYDPAQLTRRAHLLLDTRGVIPAAPHVEAL